MPAVRRAIVLAIAVLVVVAGAAHAATVTLAKVGDFAAPVYVTAPLGDTSARLRGRAGRDDPGRQGRRRAVDLPRHHAQASTRRQRARPALDGLRARLRDERPVLRLLHGEEPDRPAHDRGAPRRPGEPRPRGSVLRAPAGDDPARPAGQPQRRPAAVRPRRPALRRAPATAAAAAIPSGNAQTTTPAPPTVVRRRQPRLPPGQAPAHRPAPAAPPRSSPTACATRGASPSTATPATSSSATSARTATRRSTSPPPRAIGAGGNYGWNTLRGRCTPTRATRRRAARRAPSCRSSSTRTAPACSITGGYVVRDPALPELAGTYLYGDNCTGDISRRHAAGAATAARAGLQRGERVELRRGRLRARLRRVARRRRLPLREQRRVRRAGALRRPAAGRRRPGAPAAGPDRRAPALHPAARRRAPARAAHRLRHHPRALRRAVHRERERARAHHAPRARRRRRRSCARAPRGRRWWPARARPCA